MKLFIILLVALSLWASSLLYLTGDTIATRQDGAFSDLASQHQRLIQHKERASLVQFFSKYRCPRPWYLTEFINASEEHQIDFRLLPAIEMAESTCRQHYLFNNPFGWNSDKTGFGSLPEAIDFVASQLSGGSIYKGKTTFNKLRTYNPNATYAPRVMRFMKEISNE